MLPPKALIAAAIAEYGRIDALVSNAAVNPTAGPIADTPSDAIDKARVITFIRDRVVR